MAHFGLSVSHGRGGLPWNVCTSYGRCWPMQADLSFVVGLPYDAALVSWYRVASAAAANWHFHHSNSEMCKKTTLFLVAISSCYFSARDKKIESPKLVYLYLL